MRWIQFGVRIRTFGFAAERVALIPQVAQARRFPLGADSLVKRQRLGDRVVIGRRVRADLLEFADVAVLRGAGRRERQSVGISSRRT